MSNKSDRKGFYAFYIIFCLFVAHQRKLASCYFTNDEFKIFIIAFLHDSESLKRCDNV